VETAISSIFCFRADDRQGSGLPGLPIEKDEEQEDIRPIDAIYCKACGYPVTGRDQEISVHGSHAHTFFNPAGIVFELGCFRTAPGCHGAGETTSNFTWFAGYVWRFALCGRCNSHLGWYFEMGEHSFLGLILANLRE